MPSEYIEVALIDIPDVRVTAVYDEELTQQLRDSLARTGQLQPIVVVQSGERYELVDGLHRLQDAQARKSEKIQAMVYAGDSVDAKILNLVTNRLRGKTKASEMVTVIDSLVHDHGMDSDAICERTGLGRDYVERLWKISEAHPEVRDSLDREVIGVGVAYELSRLPHHAQQEEVLPIAVRFNMSVRQLKEKVDEVLAIMAEPVPEPVSAPLPPPPERHCETCHAVPESRNLLTLVEVCPSCFGAMYAAGQAQARQRNGHPAEVEGGTP